MRALIAKKDQLVVFNGQDGHAGLRLSIHRAGASSRRFQISRCAVSILRAVFFPSFMFELRAERRGAASGYGMDDPHHLMA